MGLDIFLYKLKKVNLLEDKVYNYKEEDLQEYSTHLVKEKELLPKQLIDNFAQIVKVEYINFDQDKIYQVFKAKYPEHYKSKNRPRDLVFWRTGESHTARGSHYRFSNDGDEIEINCVTEEDLTPYVTKNVEETYVYKIEEVDYQRKGLTEMGWKLLPGNCEFCMDYDVVVALTEEGLSETFLDNWVDGETALVAWW